MTVIVTAVGRLRRGPIRQLCEDYAARLPWRVEWREVEEKRKMASHVLKEREADLLTAAVPDGPPLIALDRAGSSLSSAAFSKRLIEWRELGGGTVAFAIGGADGLHETVIKQARFTLSLGPLTWPHMLVRAMLMEQLWRAHSIATGHPYHRE